MYYPVKNGVEKRIESWKLVVPLFDNEGKRFRKEVIDEIKSKIIREFGGFSAINTIGEWKSGEQIFQDESTIIIIDIPVKEHESASAFFTDLKEELIRQLRQKKVYVTYENRVSELLSINEFLQELGLEIPSDHPPLLSQEDINKLAEQSETLQNRLAYNTISLERNKELGLIIWEREVLGIIISTKIEDKYPDDIVILAADKLETYFNKGTFGKPLVIIGDYEYQSFILDKEKRRYVIGNPLSFSKYDEGDIEPLYGPHAWHGTLRTPEFISTYTEEILINYIILRELGNQQKRIIINVGSDGSQQSVGDLMLRCPAVIPDKKVQRAIIDGFIKAKNIYEDGTIDKIALMQAKVMNRYNEKKALIVGSRKLMSN